MFQWKGFYFSKNTYNLLTICCLESGCSWFLQSVASILAGTAWNMKFPTEVCELPGIFCMFGFWPTTLGIEVWLKLEGGGRAEDKLDELWTAAEFWIFWDSSFYRIRLCGNNIASDCPRLCTWGCIPRDPIHVQGCITVLRLF